MDAQSMNISSAFFIFMAFLISARTPVLSGLHRFLGSPFF
ncbi:hypothetical protein ATH33_0534 [Thermoactinomyces vulgaris]|nr:hypothetical protein ATH33_0534 [Thermoactinomyces vulgaris]